MKILVYEKEMIIKDLNFLIYNKMSLKQFYHEIKNAMNSNKDQSIWYLSKIITRHQLNDIEKR